MKISRLVMVSLVTAVGFASSSDVSAQLPTQKVLTLDVAQAIAAEAVANCRTYNQKITVYVVNSANQVLAMLHDDGADVATFDVARMKATTVLAFGGKPSSQAGPGGGPPPAAANAAPNAPPAPNAAGGQNPGAPPAGAPPAGANAPAGAGRGGGGGGMPANIGPVFGVPGTLNVGGGEPIKVGDQVIGAVAVSGVIPAGRQVPGGDSGCANAGIAKVANLLR